ncbi:Cof-type HAD-IIB family hydrolase [Neisseria chenwenguii]|uniref:Hydrolase n=1 Tax=Neisseria chenwenguii TaxID=1853278 RepID=A0A220S2X9_9NEIS|nr:Cof-type HAD-IIB family hydrolase [Neisseria chenwenguii]ASK27787.1 hydrolase [Neisseria chenwenguii]ROV56529.1 Cof-type HAD-IIB family hydrolase [Neisseria chenwenguii]
MKNPKIVFFDIDDTLYRKYTDTLRPSVAQAVRALKARGILTAIATGRPPAGIPKKVREMAAEEGIDLLVTINGQYIEYHGKPLQTYPMDTAKVETMCAYFDSKNIAYAFVGSETIAVSARTEWAEESMRNILPEHPEDKHYYKNRPVYQMLVFYPDAREAELAGKIAEAGLKTVRWHEIAVDMLNQEGSKARGIADAVAKLDIAMKDVMAFGDGLNDLEMLQAVGFGVAMGNGADAAKAVAKHICPSVDEDGVYRGLIELGVIEAV